MALKNIYVVNLEASQAGLNGIEDVLTSPRVGIGQSINRPPAHLAGKAVAVDITFCVGIRNVTLRQSFSDREENL